MNQKADKAPRRKKPSQSNHSAELEQTPFADPENGFGEGGFVSDHPSVDYNVTPFASDPDFSGSASSETQSGETQSAPSPAQSGQDAQGAVSDGAYGASRQAVRQEQNSRSGMDQTSADILGKVPPHSIEAEQAVLGGIFLRSDSVLRVMDILTPEDFYIPAHRFIFSAVTDLFSRNAPIDLVTVAEHLKSQGQLEQAGSSAYLATLAQGVISAANAEYLAATVRDKALLRKMIDSCADIISQCYDPAQEVQAVLDQSEQSIFSVAQRTNSRSFIHTKELSRKVFDDLTKRFNQREMVTGVTTGYQRLDFLTAGFQPSDLVILAARPSMGKTALAMNMLMRAAVTRQKTVAVFSLEMSTDQLMMRMLCSWARIDLSKLRRSYLEPEDWLRLQEAADVLSKAPIYIDDTPAISTLELRSRVRRLKAEKGVDMVMIDYLQLMRAGRRYDSRELEISEISRSLKALAKELNIPVMALAQLNRKLEERADKRPILSDLRESGAIEQDADVIMFIYRSAVYDKAANKAEPGPAEIIIGKQRNGPVGTADLVYFPAYTAFEDMARPSEGAAT